MEFILKGGRGGMIVPAGFSLTFSLTNDSLDYFSVCEIQVTDEPYSPLDKDAITWNSIPLGNTSDRIIPRSVISNDLRCPHLLFDNRYNPELREYYITYSMDTILHECSTGIYDLHVELDNMTDIYSVVIWAFRLLNNSQCISTNKSMTVIMRKYISDPGVLCMYRNKTLQHDSLTVMYANCEPIITARFITLRMSKDVFRHDLSNVVEVGIFGHLTSPLDDSIGSFINISLDINKTTLTDTIKTTFLSDNNETKLSDNNEMKLYDNNVTILTNNIETNTSIYNVDSLDRYNSNRHYLSDITPSQVMSTAMVTIKPDLIENKQIFRIIIIILSISVTIILFILLNIVRINRKPTNYDKTISNALIVTDIYTDMDKEGIEIDSFVNNKDSCISLQMNPSLKELYDNSIDIQILLRKNVKLPMQKCLGIDI